LPIQLFSGGADFGFGKFLQRFCIRLHKSNSAVRIDKVSTVSAQISKFGKSSDGTLLILSVGESSDGTLQILSVGESSDGTLQILSIEASVISAVHGDRRAAFGHQLRHMWPLVPEVSKRIIRL
jgi:hypothetical protein